MEMEAKVLEAVALLRQAGRMDLLKEGALARRASAGVAAAVGACSLPRVVAADQDALGCVRAGIQLVDGKRCRMCQRGSRNP
ncbi:hypothetical protein NDU88_004648 [Pleurodeles waltl]|uniref:Uncharacterized protein n=1 Tax=Pleurodeles waltl TaxID=8319 RepID=A0AAV7PDP5_PLEWA|nr:hypothetical protein NDU88_004648 [Pleurodeles waltl]